MLNINLNIILNPSDKSAFVEAYARLIGSVRPSRSLLVTTARLVESYIVAQQELQRELKSAKSDIFGWLKRKTRIAKMRENVSEIQNKLEQWVSTTLAFFGIGTGSIMLGGLK